MSQTDSVAPIQLDAPLRVEQVSDDERFYREYGITDMDRRVHAMKMREAEERVDDILAGRR